MFRFKQFNVDQIGCAMKINTDGVLLGAMAEAIDPESILDIGTGTGVIALMLAQKYTGAKVDAVEIDKSATQTAERNFENSPFADRLNIFPVGFESYFEQFPQWKYDHIVSNPPFYIDSLKSPRVRKTLAKHTDVDFFERLVKAAAGHLTTKGCFWLILPNTAREWFTQIASNHGLFPEKLITIQSYTDSEPHRIIICFSFADQTPELSNFIIYNSKGIYSDEYKRVLQPYFLAF